MPPGRSHVWNHFKRLSDDKTVKCNLCQTELIYNGGTTSMLNHLHLKHAEETKPKTEDKAKQPAMTSFLNSPRKTTSGQREAITQLIANMVVTDYLPLSIVEGKGFRALLNELAPDYEVPCRGTIRARVNKKFEAKREDLCKSLKSVTSAALTTDTWTSTSTDSYITVTEHHITDDWRMESNVLMTREMPERHTGANIARKLQDSVAEFGLVNKVESCVHDNARNMERAGDLCTDWSDHGCFAHTLQLCVKPALDIPQVEKVVSKGRKLVGHFRHSTTLTSEMRRRQKMLDLPQHELIQDVCTRWNSTQLMMERLCEQRRVIMDIMLDDKITKKADLHLLPSDRDWEAMSEISSVLKDLTKVTTFMSGETDVSNSYIFPIVCGLITKTLATKPDEDSLVRRVKESVLKELNERFRPSDIKAATSLPAIAALLDPRYKRLSFFTKSQRHAAEAELESRLDDIPLRLPGRNSEEPTPSKILKTDSELDFLNFTSPEKQSDSDEFQDYLQEKTTNTKPLDWWREHEDKYPRIAAVAKKVLCVPATSVPSERVFSSAGILVTKLRNRLSPTLVDGIIFLNKNNVSEREECD